MLFYTGCPKNTTFFTLKNSQNREFSNFSKIFQNQFIQNPSPTISRSCVSLKVFKLNIIIIAPYRQIFVHKLPLLQNMLCVEVVWREYSWVRVNFWVTRCCFSESSWKSKHFSYINRSHRTNQKKVILIWSFHVFRQKIAFFISDYAQNERPNQSNRQ